MPCRIEIASRLSASVTSPALKRGRRYRLVPAWNVASSSVARPKMCDIGITA
jgi:hypothetical protein